MMRMQLRIVWCSCVLSALGCGGCGFFVERPVMRVPPERVRQVQTVRLEEHSRSAPVPLSEAATQPAERAPRRKSRRDTA